MDRGVRAIVSHRLPNAEELNAGCGDWLECCQAYIHAEGCAEATNPTNEHREQAREDRVVITGRVVNINAHGEPTRARLREIEASVGNGYEREYRELGWSKALQSQLRDLHFLLTFFRSDDTTEPGYTIEASAALSSRDAEIREVLGGLRMGDKYDGGCWCIESPIRTREPGWRHNKYCKAATALYAKLQPLQIENPPDTLRE